MNRAADEAAGEREWREAHGVARAAIDYVQADPERLERFMALTGLVPADLDRAPAEPGVLAGVLRQLVQDEPTLLAFSAASRLAPERVMAAVQALDRQHWAREVP